MRKILFILWTLISINSYCQNTYKTFYGDYMPPTGTIRTLNLFINIIYDQSNDPFAQNITPFWMPGAPNSINNNPPSYLAGFLDHTYNPNNIVGSFTKRYAQASFNQLIVLGDFIVVNINQSRITPDNPGASFDYLTLINEAIELINSNGGLTTIHNHNNISDYDGMQISASRRFLLKTPDFNSRIDLVQIFLRNSTASYGYPTYDDRGITGFANYLQPIFINDAYHFFDAATCQGSLLNKDLAHPATQRAEIHELAHNMIGMSNSAHMGGGGPVNVGDLVTLEFNSGGYSLIGSAGSSLVSCNGFERWRLNYRGPTNSSHAIASNNVNSDISITDGSKTFYLRDFITYGDAIRIKLPYKDIGALDQYIWLENHQIHYNNKEEYPGVLD